MDPHGSGSETLILICCILVGIVVGFIRTRRDIPPSGTTASALDSGDVFSSVKY